MPAIPAPYTYLHEICRVYTAAVPGVGDDWTERPYLRVASLVDRMAPDIGRCQLVYHCGQFATRESDEFGNPPVVTPTWYAPLDVSRNFVKVEILEQDPDGNDPTVRETWYGVIKVDDRRQVRQASDPENFTGTQVLTAFDLSILLDEAQIASSIVEDQAGTVEIQRGLPFNFKSRAGQQRRGNRSADVDDGVYVFAFEPASDAGEDDDDFWSAEDAVKYLLKHQRPKNEDDEDLCEWVYEGAAVDWYDITVETDRLSVKSVIDKLLDRRRMVGYRVYGRETETAFEAVLEVVTFIAEAIELEDGEIEANPDVVDLLTGGSTIIDQMQVSRVDSHSVDVIRVEGEYCTTTGTWVKGNNAAGFPELAAGWKSELEDEYKSPGGSDEIENTKRRSRDRYRDVYARVVMDAEWGMTVCVAPEIDTDEPQEYHVAIPVEELPESIEVGDVANIFNVDNGPGSTLHFRNKRFLNYTAMREDQDVGTFKTNEFRRPFVLFVTERNDNSFPTKAVFAEIMSTDDEARQFNVSLQLLQDQLGIFLDVNKAGGQQLIAKSDWLGADATPEDLDPTIGDNGAFSLTDSMVTATIEWDERIYVEQVIQEATGAKRILRIYLPDANFDVLLPGCAKDKDDTGAIDFSIVGEVLADDRPRMRDVLAAAAAWYGTPRQVLSITYKQLVKYASVGNLIGRVFGSSDEPINTPVTGVAYDFIAGTTTIETAYPEMDFAFGGTDA